MWRAQFLAATVVAAVGWSGLTSAQPTSAPASEGVSGPGGAAAPGEPAAPAWLQVPGSTGMRSTDVQALMSLRDAVENWNEYAAANDMQGWSEAVPPCSWTGISCSDDGTIITLSWQCRSCAVRAVGTLPAGLGTISSLATLDLQSNRFYGTLPPSWGGVDTWTGLQNIYLNDNNLTGTIPQEWGAEGSMPSLAQLRLDSNHLTGILPQNWGLEETSMQELGVIRLSNNSLTGTMPEQWGTPGAFPRLSVLALDSNRLTGTLPVIWGSPRAMTLLQELYVQYNQLTGGLPSSWGGQTGMIRLRFVFAANNPLGGTLPPEWGAAGSFPELKTLDLNSTQLWGTLPAEWGDPSSLPKLDALRLERNDLSGTIPPEWASMPSLSRLAIRPGNPRLCGPTPPGLRFSLCDDQDLTCLRSVELSPACGPILAPPRSAGGPAPEAAAGSVEGAAGGAAAGTPAADIGQGAAPDAAAAAGGADDGGGSSTGAIVGGAVGGGVAALLLAGLLWLAVGRRRRRRLEEQRQQEAMMREEALKPSARPFISEEEELEMGMGPGGGVGSGGGLGTLGLNGSASILLSPFAVAAPLREYRASYSSRSMFASQACSKGSLPAAAAAAERRPSRFGSLLAGSGLLPSTSGSMFRWCVESPRTESLELEGQEGEAQQQSPRAGVMAQIAEGEEGGDRKKTLEDGRPATAVPPATVLVPASPSSLINSMAGSSARTLGGPGGGGSGMPRLGSYVLPWVDWEIRPEEIEIAKRPDGSDWLLGSGGFGKVYKAFRHGVQPVAVKVIPLHGEHQSPAAVQEARQEIAILRACRDVNIVQFVGAYLGPEETMLVTEYLEGGDLMRNIAAGRVSWYRRGKKIAMDVARGLVFLHSRRIAHFDLKSPNILLARDGTAKIADCGMAKVLNRDYITGVVATLAWSAPEMLWGAKCTEKADIYSFGVLLWEIVSGEAPERGRLRDLRVPEECPPEVRQLILECLEARPSLRPTALQLVDLLSRAPGVPPPGVQLPPPSSPSTSPARTAAALPPPPQAEAPRPGVGDVAAAGGEARVRPFPVPPAAVQGLGQAEEQQQRQQEQHGVAENPPGEGAAAEQVAAAAGVVQDAAPAAAEQRDGVEVEEPSTPRPASLQRVHRDAATPGASTAAAVVQAEAPAAASSAAGAAAAQAGAAGALAGRERQ